MIEFTEQRVVNKLCSYWNLLKGDRDYPANNEIELEEIREIWPYCFVIKIDEDEDEIKKYSFVYLGDKAAEIYDVDMDLTVNHAKVLSPSIINHLYPCLDAVLKGKEPIIDELDFQDTIGDDLRGRQCLLPLSEDGKRIDCILGAVSCRKEKYNYFYDVNT